MKLVLSIAFGIYTVLSSAQQGCSFQYAISEKGVGKVIYDLTILAKNGDTRSEYREVSSGQIINTCLKLKRRPGIWYNVLGGTYLEIPDQRLKNYEVSVLGTETINTYNCTKISLTIYKDSEPIIVWLSKEIPDYEKYLDVEVNDMNLIELNKALKGKNAGGIPVKIEGRGEMVQVLELVSVQKVTDIDDSLFDAKEKQKGSTSDELKKQNKITEEQYQLMKVEEERARKEYENKQEKKPE